MQDKVFLRMEQKLDALLAANGIDVADFGEAGGKMPSRPPRELTAAEQQAIDNAPKYVPAKEMGTAAQPTSEQAAPIPPEAVGQATVVTEQPDGKTVTSTKPVSEVKEQTAKAAKG